MINVAIVGRPNVGKSSLFNRLLGSRDAIVEDVPGVTRDVKERIIEHDEGWRYALLDTGGLWSADAWEDAVLKRTAHALENADLVLFCFDGREGVTSIDERIADWLRSRNIDVVPVATKIDDERHTESAAVMEAFQLGFGTPILTSANHGRGIAEIVDLVRPLATEDDAYRDSTERLTVAIVGRPNAGKSSLLNGLLGEERVIVSSEAGTTRDAIDVEFEWGGRPFVLIDTAGIRRKPSEDLEFYTKLRSERAIRRADVVVLVVDPFELGDHEHRLANMALEHGTPTVVALNKMDLVPAKEKREVVQHVRTTLEHLHSAPHVPMSALKGDGLVELLAECASVYEEANQRIATGMLNAWIEVWTERQSPPNFKGRPLKILYATQAAVAPPTFIFSVNHESFVTRSYEQYLINRIKDDLGFSRVPVRLVFKDRGQAGGKRVRTSS